jgi:hypothetical protein
MNIQEREPFPGHSYPKWVPSRLAKSSIRCRSSNSSNTGEICDAGKSRTRKSAAWKVGRNPLAGGCLRRMRWSRLCPISKGLSNPAPLLCRLQEMRRERSLNPAGLIGTAKQQLGLQLRAAPRLRRVSRRNRCRDDRRDILADWVLHTCPESILSAARCALRCTSAAGSGALAKRKAHLHARAGTVSPAGTAFGC